MSTYVRQRLSHIDYNSHIRHKPHPNSIFFFAEPTKISLLKLYKLCHDELTFKGEITKVKCAKCALAFPLAQHNIVLYTMHTMGVSILDGGDFNVMLMPAHIRVCMPQHSAYTA